MIGPQAVALESGPISNVQRRTSPNGSAEETVSKAVGLYF